MPRKIRADDNFMPFTYAPLRMPHGRMPYSKMSTGNRQVSRVTRVAGIIILLVHLFVELTEGRTLIHYIMIALFCRQR